MCSLNLMNYHRNEVTRRNVESTQMTLWGLNAENTELLRIKSLPFSRPVGALWLTLRSLICSWPLTPFVTRTSCAGKPDPSSRWQPCSGRIGCQQTEWGRKLSAWSNARLISRHLRLKFPVLALLSDFSVIQEQGSVNEATMFLSNHDIMTSASRRLG